MLRRVVHELEDPVAGGQRRQARPRRAAPDVREHAGVQLRGGCPPPGQAARHRHEHVGQHSTRAQTAGGPPLRERGLHEGRVLHRLRRGAGPAHRGGQRPAADGRRLPMWKACRRRPAPAPSAAAPAHADEGRGDPSAATEHPSSRQRPAVPPHVLGGVAPEDALLVGAGGRVADRRAHRRPSRGRRGARGPPGARRPGLPKGAGVRRLRGESGKARHRVRACVSSAWRPGGPGCRRDGAPRLRARAPGRSQPPTPCPRCVAYQVLPQSSQAGLRTRLEPEAALFIGAQFAITLHYAARGDPRITGNTGQTPAPQPTPPRATKIWQFARPLAAVAGAGWSVWMTRMD